MANCEYLENLWFFDPKILLCAQFLAKKIRIFTYVYVMDFMYIKILIFIVILFFGIIQRLALARTDCLVL